ncbi:hypothetical protein HYFRA_00004871 [Hymenoscyphus fraxineus]|uniref:Uncharacterized protein n=1 Tax=Hymenoscyphus fraxineus TaxID=746836 RepID=A0A9N9KLP0_9HELO|nr:hypothetical protein HYFRA_00004871 [Hymenoscyphus fraxineus]
MRSSVSLSLYAISLLIFTPIISAQDTQSSHLFVETILALSVIPIAAFN